jgi:RNA polymerase sigma-70 factor (ECF subfamily)
VERDDSQLIQQSVRGDRAAFGLLVRRYQDRLFNTVVRILGNADDAADIVQESFLHAFVKLEAFKGNARFFTWLYRIAVNASISMKRKQKTLLSSDSHEALPALMESIDRSEASRPESALDRRERIERLEFALNRLTPDHRAVIVLKEIEELSYESIAEILGVPVGTVRSRLHRARLELRDQLIKQSVGIPSE